MDSATETVETGIGSTEPAAATEATEAAASANGVSNLFGDPATDSPVIATEAPVEPAAEPAVRTKRAYNRKPKPDATAAANPIATNSTPSEIDNKSTTITQQNGSTPIAATGSRPVPLSSDPFTNIQTAISNFPESTITLWIIPELARAIGAWDYRKVFRAVREEYGEVGIYCVLKIMIAATKGEKHSMIRSAAACEVSNARTSGKGIDTGKGNNGISAVESVMKVALEVVNEMAGMAGRK